MNGATGLDVRRFAPQDLLGPLNEVERKHAPASLYVAGDEGLLRSGCRVSIVGSRRASSNSIRRARKLAKALVGRGVVVVSGLAEGIDTAAHHAAIEHEGRTIAVLGTALDVVYPRSNSDLQWEIAMEHAAVSQFPAGSPTRRYNFPTRNRTMALISDATVIVTAGERSGTVHQGWEALRLGRDLLLLESQVKRGVSWTSDMMNYGADVLRDDNFERWLDSLPEPGVFDEVELVL